MRQSTFLVPPKLKINLGEYDPAFVDSFKDKDDATAKLTKDVERLRALQDIFYASHHYAMLIILQGMDTAGKDGVIKHVMSGLNPQAVQVTSFKQPAREELQHDFLWRAVKALPARGNIGIFNRSYYEDVLVPRVHQEVLQTEDILFPKHRNEIWKQRYEDINNLELHLVRNGTIVLKFYLNISKDEQRNRLLRRIEDPEKNWKFSESDIQERKFWNEYRKAYEDVLSNTSADHAPWYVLPADHKWFTRVAIADVIVEKMKSLNLQYPVLDEKQKAALREAKKLLEEQ